MIQFMKTAATIGFILIASVFVPNVLWLSYSTVRFTNDGTVTLRSVIAYVDDKEKNIGELAPGETRFILLPKSGEANFRVEYEVQLNMKTACREYVEGEMYHVEAMLESSLGSRCRTSIPLLTDFLILKLI